MFNVLVVDLEAARDPSQLTGAGVRNYHHRQRGHRLFRSNHGPGGMNEPDLPPTDPVKCSMDTYPAEPGVAV